MEELILRPSVTASRYEPGHVDYMGYCAAFESMKWLREIGIENALAHSVALNKRLLEKIDTQRYRCISPDLERSPILTLMARETEGLREKLSARGITVTITADRIRISPALYNNETDIDKLATALNEPT